MTKWRVEYRERSLGMSQSRTPAARTIEAGRVRLSDGVFEFYTAGGLKALVPYEMVSGIFQVEDDD